MSRTPDVCCPQTLECSLTHAHRTFNIVPVGQAYSQVAGIRWQPKSIHPSKPMLKLLPSTRRFKFLLSVWLLLSLMLAKPFDTAIGQERPPVDIKLTVNGLDPASLKSLTFSDPQNVKLSAKDKFELAAIYYPGVHGKNTPPIILLHDVLGAGEDLTELAIYLQKTFGYAVLVPDLRGHGHSKKTGKIEIDSEKIGRDEFAAMALDIEACKKFLIARNDDGELNIDMLNVVAIGKSCISAVNWAIGDWSYPVLVGLRQGQDVKALALVSPEQSFKGIRMTNAIKSGLFTGKDVEKPLRILLAAGTDDPSTVKEVESIASIVERHRTKNEDALDGLFVLKDYATNGAELTTAEAGDLQKLIGQFVFLEIFKKQSDFPWAVRTKK